MKKLKIIIITLVLITSIFTIYILIKNKNIKAKAEILSNKESIQQVQKVGDINNDGQIDAIDASYSLQISAALAVKKVPEIYGNNGEIIKYDDEIVDVNEDGKIDANDASIILSYSAKVGSGAIDNNTDIRDFFKSEKIE